MKKTFPIAYFLGRTFFLGFGFSMLFKLLNKDTWIACLLGSILGFLIILGFTKYKKKRPIEGPVLKTIFFLYNFFIFTEILFIFETFCSSFYLVKSPIIYIILPIPFIIYRIAKNGFTTISKVSEVLLPISIVLYVFVVSGLLQNIRLTYFAPVLSSKPFNLIQGSIYFAIYSTAPFFLLWNVQSEHLPRSYLFSMLGILIISLVITGVLGPYLSQIYRFPEYMTMKKLKLFNFIEKVENIVSITWLFSLFITMSVTGYNLKELLPNKKKPFFFGLVLVLVSIVSWYLGTYYKDALEIYHYLPIILGSLMILLFVCSFFKKKASKIKN